MYQNVDEWRTCLVLKVYSIYLGELRPKRWYDLASARQDDTAKNWELWFFLHFKSLWDLDTIQNT
jgi:hypothetical protein